MEYVSMRWELVGYLESLSDKDYQINCWVHDNCPGNVQHDNFDLAIHFLYDDTALYKDAELNIGTLLYNKAEAKKINLLVKALDLVFDKYGLEMSDEEYINVPEWEEVMATAKVALTLLQENDVLNKTDYSQ